MIRNKNHSDGLRIGFVVSRRLFLPLFVFLFCFILSFVVGSITIRIHQANAVTGLGLVGEPSLSMNVSTDKESFNVTPSSDGSMMSGSHTVTVGTNVPTGYNLSISTTRLSDGIIPVMGTLGSPVALTNNTWGYAINRVASSTPTNTVVNGFDTVYSTPTPSVSSKWASPSVATTLRNTTQSAASSVTTIYYGAKVDFSLAAGRYDNTVKYTVESNMADIAAPSITSITPNSGDSAGGQQVVIVGSEFTTNDQSVTQKITIGGSDCTDVSISSNTPIAGRDTIYCTVPAHDFTSGPTKATDVVVSTWGGNTTFAGGYTYTKELFKFTVDTRMTDTLDTAANHYSGTAKTFSIPVSGYEIWSNARPYNWSINCGDGSAYRVVSGTGSASSAGIVCTYATAGAYQITITPAGHSNKGWMSAFGFHNSTAGANSQANKNMFKTIDTSFAPNAKVPGATAFMNVFYGAKNATSIPGNLFENVAFPLGTPMAHIFRNTFARFGYNSTSMTIPAGLFRNFDTSATSSFEYAFGATFNECAYNSKNATIPADLFSTIDTRQGTNFRYAFIATFSRYGFNSTVGEIPSGLFDSISTGNGTQFPFTFQHTFYNYARKNVNGNIPAGLFKNVDTSKGTIFTYMFGQTFSYFAEESTAALIPPGLFEKIDTTQGTDLRSMFSSTFAYYGQLSTMLTIPNNLFNGIKTANATDLRSTFQQTFLSCGTESTVGTIPSDLFSNVNTSNAQSKLRKMFEATFHGYALANNGNTHSSDVNSIWGSAVLTGITASNVGGNDDDIDENIDIEIGVMYRTFYNVPHLRGTAQTFITNRLGDITPAVDAQTFSYSAGLSDFNSIDVRWRSE